MKYTLLISSLAALTILAGCNRGSLETADMDGVRYRIEGAGVRFQSRQNYVEAGNQVSGICVKGGHLYQNGRDLGPVGSGDVVRLTSSGSVLVNDASR